MSNSLHQALQSAYAGAGEASPEWDTSTVRGLFDFCCSWLDDAVSAEALNNPCLEMAARLKVAGREELEELRRNPQLDPLTVELMTCTADGYLAIAELLEELPELAADRRTANFEAAMESFEQQREAILDAQAELEELVDETVPLCPRCGSEGAEERCPGCELVRLYPSTAAMQDLCRPSPGGLPQALSPAHRAFLQTLQGVSGMEDFLGRLPPIVELFGNLLTSARRLIDSEGATAAEVAQASRLAGRAEAALAALERLPAVQTSLRTSELSRFWNEVLSAATVISHAAVPDSPHYEQGGEDDVTLSPPE